MNNDCKIVEDLLPTYIEKMTSAETTEFIEKHLENCENCKKVLEEMKADINKENVENTEIVKKIKKYKRKIFTIKLFIIILVLLVLCPILGTIGYRYSIIYNAIDKNTMYDLGTNNYIFIEYDTSIETDSKPTITYHLGDKLKKVCGDEVLEYANDTEYYILDNENKTYKKIEYDEDAEYFNNKNLLNVNVKEFEDFKNVLDENGKIKKLEILKIALNKTIKIWNEGFRNKDYYMIKSVNLDGDYEKMYFDKDTFLAERVYINSQPDFMEYRVIPDIVSWRNVQEPNLSDYTEVK